MNYSDIFNLINDIERKFPVCEWQVNDIDVWPFIRISFMEHNMNGTDSGRGNTESRMHSRWNLVYNGILSLIVDRKHQGLLQSADILTLGSNGERTIETKNGEYISQNLDPIIVQLDKRGIKCWNVEDIQGAALKIPRYTLSDFHVTWESLKSIVKNKLFKRNNDSCKLPQYESVYEYIRTKDVKENIAGIGELCRCANYICDMADYFERIIQEKKIKLVLEVCWYGLMGMALSVACRRNNLDCIDIQHGLAGANLNGAYARWCAVPKKGYNTMPTHFWCWSDKDVEAVETWTRVSTCERATAFLGGVPTDAVYSVCASDIGKEWIMRIQGIKGHSRKLCLLTLQTGYEPPQWIVNAIVSTKNSIEWLVRKHPFDDRVQQEFIKKVEELDNVEWKLASSCPLGIILNYVTCHVTLHSAVVHDAARRGIHSAVVSNLGYQLYADEIECGNCCYAKNEEELIAFLKKETNVELLDRNDASEDLPGIDYIVGLLGK